MDESKMFGPKIGSENEKNKEQPIKPFIKKVEAREDFTCNGGCGNEIKKGEEAWLVLTQKDIDREFKMDANAKPKPTIMCKDCLDEKVIEDSEK